MTASMMVSHLGDSDEAKSIAKAVEEAVKAGDCTRDVGGSLGTSEAGDAIVKRLAG